MNDAINSAINKPEKKAAEADKKSSARRLGGAKMIEKAMSGIFTVCGLTALGL